MTLSHHSHPTTVAELRAALADLPDWAPVQVASYDEHDCREEHTAYLDYTEGVLTIDVAYVAGIRATGTVLGA